MKAKFFILICFFFLGMTISCEKEEEEVYVPEIDTSFLEEIFVDAGTDKTVGAGQSIDFDDAGIIRKVKLRSSKGLRSTTAPISCCRPISKRGGKPIPNFPLPAGICLSACSWNCSTQEGEIVESLENPTYLNPTFVAPDNANGVYICRLTATVRYVSEKGGKASYYTFSDSLVVITDNGF